MTKKLNKPDQSPESGAMKQNDIQQKIWPIILFALVWEQQDESKEIVGWSNIIICRRHESDKKNDIQALQSQLPEIMKNVTYIQDPSKVVDHLKVDRKNIVFLGFYFDNTMNGMDVAHKVKEKWCEMNVDTHVVMVTSVHFPYGSIKDCDEYYSVSWEHSDEKNVIVQHLKKMMREPENIKREKPTKGMFLEAKLEILHKLLGKDIPDQLPEVISQYTESFEAFKQSVKECADIQEQKYIEALSKFRDILLAE